MFKNFFKTAWRSLLRGKSFSFINIAGLAIGIAGAIHKVLGASVFSITKLLSLDFVKLVVVSIVIAIPVAYYAMNKWLQDYTYRIKLAWEYF